MPQDISIRALNTAEIQLALDWAGAEGWNPGLGDAACFAAVDPGGFLVAEMEGAPAAVISVVNYDARFAFLGFYIVRPEMRGRGIGFRLWQAGLAHAGERTIGLDGVLAQQANYAREGFVFAHRNIRFEGVPGPGEAGATVDLAQVPFEAIATTDAQVFPAPRAAFLKAWLTAPRHAGRAVLREGRLKGWGVVRPARAGWKIGPLIAEDAEVADELFRALRAAAGDAPIVLDVPEPNVQAVALAQRHRLGPVFETARMYRGSLRPATLEPLFGVTSFELG
ncbi:acetyltransferase (GNAT) family protein [Ancylobacter aquaticus]|uniref:Acetyltransferase (GNAT) family protein n=1 Tax=Ancylobacter aquaticus TaxID=100 RepID=A0A4R1HPU2_ANCAQ|nr:GNAT family N-acetyltransferase [Ancylobacter aquaticus]TCK23173.1 acetyltransferase (GNAT) family protein [Ancylobacter aquaticus]